MEENQLLSVENIYNLLRWSDIQSHILTGGGNLNFAAIKGENFHEEDLPHHFLKERFTRNIIKEWISADKRSFAIVGCWDRPLFSGGWMESSYKDTIAYNLQTPSIFIDLRFPTKRPIYLRYKRKSLKECNDLELRILARQHCFGGFTLSEVDFDKPTFTRHHIIDWNYHPNFPRLRPNRWWIELNANDSSFKEFSFVRDVNDIPIYFERWDRRQNDSFGRFYLALRKRVKCPFEAISNGDEYSRDSLLVIVGNYFAIITDRKVLALPDFNGYGGAGGCASLVDFAIKSKTSKGRDAAESMLDLVGMVGEIFNENQEAVWGIIKCTHPWLEGNQAFDKNSVISVQYNAVDLKNSIENEINVVIDGEIWDALECSFSEEQLRRIFNIRYSSNSIKQRCRL